MTSQPKSKTKVKPKYNMWQCAGWMISLAWRNKERELLLVCLLLAFSAVALNLTSLYIAPSILSVVENHGSILELLVTVLVFVLLMMICQAASAYLNSFAIFDRVSMRSTVIVKNINHKACTTSFTNHSEKEYQELEKKSNAATDDNRQATEAVWNTLTELLQNIAGFVIYTALFALVDIRLVFIILFLAAIGYLVNQRLSSYRYQHREEIGDLENRLWQHSVNAGSRESAKDVRIFHMKPWLTELRDKSAAAVTAFCRREQQLYLWGSILDFVLAFLRDGIAYAYLIMKVLSGNLDVAAFLLYFNAVSGFSGWVTGIMENLTTLYRQSLDLSTVREYLTYPEKFRFEDGASIPGRENVLHEIRLEHVSFRYPNAAENTLEDISLTIHPGEKIAVVGINGAGKTTLVNIICGLFDPTEGRVLLDGVDIRTYNRREYYRLFSAVFQKFSLLASTVAANVAQSEDCIDMARVKSCVAMAGLTKKIESLPEQYESHLNRDVYDDATELSGGELQRLMLARALYKGAPVILLDEPTAALDPLAEADLYSKYDELTNGCSSIYISHRLASTRFCDRILLLDGHVIAEEGTHEQLLARGGSYAKMFETQKKYYDDTNPITV